MRGTMSARQELNAYITRLEQRLRLGTLSRGSAILAGAALGATIVLAVALSVLAFSEGSVTGARLALFVALAFASVFGLGLPFWRLTRIGAARRAEDVFPGFQQRLETFVNKETSDDPFLDLLASDALDVARTVAPEAVAPNAALMPWLCAGAGALALLVWLVVGKPGAIGYGANMLWSGSRGGAAPLTELHVSPGDATVRRNTDQVITAQTPGLLTPQIVLYARYQSAAKWEQVAMQPRPGASGYQFVLTGVPENVEYYVEAGPRRSRRFNLRVVDLPAITQIKVTYHYPSWTGLKDASEEGGGDLRALEGTRADLDVVTDRPLTDGLLVLDGGAQVHLSGGAANHYQGVVPIERDGAYHVAALDQGQAVRLSEDYFIEARKTSPPEVSIARPGGDYRASAIEEVTVAVKAQDEFGLRDLDLHYSVNGGPEKAVRLLKQPGDKQASGSSVLALEDFKLVPGDLVSVYATAKDARAESHTDMLFIQVDPFEREFSQSQQAGGGGGGGGGGGQRNDPSEISRREKEMIAATFKQQSDKKATQKQAAETAKFLSEAQATLRNQSLSLSGRLEARDLTRENHEFSVFQQEMTAAAQAMTPAATQLQQQKWQDAIPEEQKALQHLLRAEATFRQIEVAFGGGGGGGAGGGAGRDLASLFDLELDTEKNQYETPQSASSADQRAEEINDALKKLDELARRQEQLAAQQRNNPAQGFEQRWQQEMLQREAEELRRQMEQLTRSQGASQGSQGAQGSQGSPGAQGQASGDSRARASQQAAQQALDRLRQAQEEMRRAASDPRAASDARLAAERLREASSLLGGMQSQVATGRLGSISKEADRLTAEEKSEADRVNKLKQSPSGPSIARDIQQLAGDRQRMADDLATLRQDMRNAARELDAGQRAASSKLREALAGMDETDVETRLQRTADWLRTGIDPSGNGTEAQIASSLQRLSDQLHQAQQALVAGGQPQETTRAAESAINNVERLRRQIEALSGQGGRGSNPGQQGQGGQNQGRENYQTGSLSRDGAGQQGSQGSQGSQGAQGAQGARGSQGAQGAQVGQGGNGSAAVSGDTRQGGGGGRGGTIYGNFDTGDNARPGTPRGASPQQTPSIDNQQTIQQGLGELTQLRREVGSDPEMQRQVQELITAMEHLDLRRFPGNPAMVEELHQRLLSGVDALELQLRRNLDDKRPGQIRSADSLVVPPGYKDAVADYFRRLSTIAPAKDREKKP